MNPQLCWSALFIAVVCSLSSVRAADPADTLVRVQVDVAGKTEDSYGIVAFTAAERTLVLCHLPVAAMQPKADCTFRVVWGNPARTVAMQPLRYRTFGNSHGLLAGPAAELPPPLPELPSSGFRQGMPLKILEWRFGPNVGTTINKKVDLATHDATIGKIAWHSYEDVSRVTLKTAETYNHFKTSMAIAVTEKGEAAALGWGPQQTPGDVSWPPCRFASYARASVSSYVVYPVRSPPTKTQGSGESGKYRYQAVLRMSDPLRQITAARMFVKLVELIPPNPPPLPPAFEARLQIEDPQTLNLAVGELAPEVDGSIPGWDPRALPPGEVLWVAEFEGETPQDWSRAHYLVQVAYVDAKKQAIWEPVKLLQLPRPKPQP